LIWCRHIAVALIKARRAYLLQKAAGRSTDTATVAESKRSHELRLQQWKIVDA
jgi:hypothetical protein